MAGAWNTANGRRRAPAARAGALSLLALVGLWAALALAANDPRTLPAPWTVAALVAQDAASGVLWQNTAATLMRVLASFAIAMSVGGAIGLGCGRSAAADRWLNPVLVIALNTPALVVIVLCYIWIGLNEAAAIAAVAVNKIPLVAVMLREGARALRPDLDDLARAYRMPAGARLRHVVLPQLAPHIASAARTGLALIWKIVLVVEFLGRSNGVGFRLHMHFQMFDVAHVLAWSVSFLAVMLAIDYGLLRPCERWASRWRRDAD